MKKINFKQHFATTYRPLTKKTTAFVYQSTCLVHFTMLAPTFIHREVTPLSSRTPRARQVYYPYIIWHR